MINCQGCHLADGTGKKNGQRAQYERRGYTNFWAVPGGREFLVQVPGSANAPLNDAELAELLNWMLESLSTDKREGSTSKSFFALYRAGSEKNYDRRCWLML